MADIDTKKKTSNTARLVEDGRWQLFTLLLKQRIAVVLFVILLILIGAFFLNVLRVSVIASLRDSQFCSAEDGIYQAIDTNGEAWSESFTLSTSLKHIYFDIGDGRPYTTIALDSPKGFFVATKYNWPHTYFGEQGYILTRNGISHIRSAYGEYVYTQISEDI